MNQVQGAVLQVDVAMATASARKQLDDLKKFAGTEFARGIALSIGHRAVGVVTGAARAAISAMSGLVEQGIAFNTTLENTEISVGALLRATSPDKMKSMPDALEAAGKAMKSLREEARYTAATFEQLLFGFQGILGAAMEAGFSTGDAVKLAATISRAVNIAMPGAAPFQLLQEGRALLTGNLQGAMLARQLGITGEQVRAAKESGKLLEFLNEKLLAFNEAADVLSGTLTTTISNIQDALNDITADATVELFGEIKAAFVEIKDAVESPGFKRFVDSLSTFASDQVQSARSGSALWGLLGVGGLAAATQGGRAVSLIRGVLGIGGAAAAAGPAATVAAGGAAVSSLVYLLKRLDDMNAFGYSRLDHLAAVQREKQFWQEWLPSERPGAMSGRNGVPLVIHANQEARTKSFFTGLSGMWMPATLYGIREGLSQSMKGILNASKSSYDMGRWQSRGGYADFYHRQNLGQRVLNEVRRIREAVDKVLKVEVAGV